MKMRCLLGKLFNLFHFIAFPLYILSQESFPSQEILDSYYHSLMQKNENHSFHQHYYRKLSQISITEQDPSAPKHHANLNIFLEKVSATLDPIVDADTDQMSKVFHHGNLCPFKRKVFDKMGTGDTIKIIIVGGSVTYGAELRNRLKERWSNLFTEILNSGWYVGKFDIVNIGVGACNIDVWITRVNELKVADLVIVDTTVNDQGFDLQVLPHYYETFIQLIDNLPNRPAIYFNQAFRGAKLDQKDIDVHCPNDYIKCCEGEMFCHRWWEMQDFVALALKKYHVPFVSYRDLVWPDYYHPSSNLNAFWNGLSHPDAKAHALLAKLIAFGFMMQVKESHRYDELNHCQEGRDKQHYVAKENKNQQIVSLCSGDFTSQMTATDQKESKNQFLLVDQLQDEQYHYWRYYNDSQLKYGWILETTKLNVQKICGEELLADDFFHIAASSSVAVPDKTNCFKAIEQHSLNIFVEFQNSSNPKLQFIFLKSYAEEMGDILVWLDDDRSESVIISGKWDTEYSVSHVATISKEDLFNVSTYIRGDNYRMKSLSPGKHVVHLSIGHFQHKEKFKWKLLAISSC